MFGIGHEVHWEGQELHVHLEPRNGFDWLASLAVVALLVLGTVTSASAITVLPPHDSLNDPPPPDTIIACSFGHEPFESAKPVGHAPLPILTRRDVAHLDFQPSPAEGFVFASLIGFLVFRRRSRLRPIRLRVRPGRWVIDGRRFDCVLAATFDAGRLVLTLGSGRTWRSRELEPIDEPTLALLRQATTGADHLRQEETAKLALGAIRRSV